jgi:hypothetical protein
VVTSDGSLWVADVSVPSAPIGVGFYTPADGASVEQVIVAGIYAYIRTSNSVNSPANSQLRIVDMSNPAAPLEIGGYIPPAGGEIYGLTIAGAYAYIVGANDLRIVNISKPAAPIEVGRYATPGFLVGGIAVVGRYAYIATYDKGLRIVDVYRPNHPIEVGAYLGEGIVLTGRVVVDGNFVYVLSERIAPSGLGFLYSLLILDVSRPAVPLKAGLYTPARSNGSVGNVAVTGGYAYATDWDVLHVVAITNPATPKEVGAYLPIGGAVRDLAADDHYAYVAGSRGLVLVDITHPAAPLEIGVYHPQAGAVYSVVPAGHYTYVGNEIWGRAIFLGAWLRVVDTSNPVAPVEAGEFRAGFVTYPAAISGTLVFAVSDYHGVDLLDISNPQVPRSTGTYTISQQLYIQSVVPSGRYLYVTTNHGLRIVDFANPGAPVELGIYVPLGGDYVADVAGFDRYVYVSTSSDIRVVDIANPSTPLEVGRYTPPDGAKTGLIAKANRYLYVGTSSGLRVIDISKPTAPQEIAFCALPFGAGALAVVGHRIYVADQLDRSGWSIFWHAAPVAASISNSGGTLASPGDATIFTFPSGAFAQTTTITFTAILADDAPATGQLVGTGHAFAITGTSDTTGQPVQPTKPYSITIQYSDAERGPAIANTLALYFWDGGRWVKEPSSTVDSAAHTVSATPSHFSTWAVLGETRRAFVALIRR